MARAAGVVALQDFLDGPARPLRRVAFLLAGSWAGADEALGTALSGLLRRGADPDDHAARPCSGHTCSGHTTGSSTGPAAIPSRFARPAR